MTLAGFLAVEEVCHVPRSLLQTAPHTAPIIALRIHFHHTAFTRLYLSSRLDRLARFSSLPIETGIDVE
jgi:hypothetical protein